MHNRSPQGRLLLAIQLIKVSTLLRNLLLSSPNFKIHPCRSFASIPVGPKLPESFHATNLTTSYVMSTEIKIGVLVYVTKVEQEGVFNLDSFPPGQMQQFHK